MAAKISVFGQILSSSLYLRSTLGGVTLMISSSNIIKRPIFQKLPKSYMSVDKRHVFPMFSGKH